VPDVLSGAIPDADRRLCPRRHDAKAQLTAVRLGEHMSATTAPISGAYGTD
jgi:hypothetical protein